MATFDKYVKHRNLSKIACALFFLLKIFKMQIQMIYNNNN